MFIYVQGIFTSSETRAMNVTGPFEEELIPLIPVSVTAINCSGHVGNKEV